MQLFFLFIVVVAVVNSVYGFSILKTSPHRRISGINSMSLSPGEVNSEPRSPVTKSVEAFRKVAVPVAALATLFAPFVVKNAWADDEVATVPAPAPAVVKVELGPPPSDFGLDYKDYYGDCTKIVNHMRYAVQLEKGNPRIAELAQKTKDEMLDFVSYYRRFQGINGKQSYSLLYTSINVLAGHYTSYGVKFPVPEKRRKRLLQEFADIDKNIRKKR